MENSMRRRPRFKKKKNRIFEKICDEKKRAEEEKEYWEYVRNELYIEDNNRKLRLQELEEIEKKIRQKEQMLASAIEQAKLKDERKKKEQE